jgi:hypothetical protein
MTIRTAVAALPVLLALSGVATAETLLIERARDEHGVALPARGMSMAQVEAQFGAPSEKLDPRGGQKRQWPTINRWSYPAFIVYFEKDRVIDAVLIKAGESEIGPKPPVR